MKEALQGLIADVRDIEFALEGSKNVLEVSKASPRMTTPLCARFKEQGKLDKVSMLSF